MLHLRVHPGDGVPLYLQILHQVKGLIASGRLVANEELPPVRTLAQQLVVNPNTVVRAYRELETAGLVYKKRGAGTYVAERSSPYSDTERSRLLSERAEALVVEGKSLGFSDDEIVAVVEERLTALRNARADQVEA